MAVNLAVKPKAPPAAVPIASFSSPAKFLSVLTVAIWLTGNSFYAHESPSVLPVWGKLMDIHAAAGFKDNLLLRRTDGGASPFLNAGLDLSLTRLPFDGTEIQLFLNAEEYHYLDSKKVDDEQAIIGFMQLSREFGGHWRASLPFHYWYQNQVFDASITETNLSTVRSQGHLLRTAPAIRRTISPHGWVEVEFSLSRQYLREPLDDFWQGGPKLAFGYLYGHKSEAALSGQIQRRSYDNRASLRNRFDIDFGRTLEFFSHTLEATWRHNFDPKQRWQTRTRIDWTRNVDNGSGFFNYDRFLAAQQVRYRAGAWEISGRIRLAHYRYARQTVSASDLSRRTRLDWLFNLRGERRLAESLKWFAEFEHEEALSNRRIEQYDVNSIFTGLEWDL